MTYSSHAITSLDSGADVVKHYRGKKKASGLNDLFGKTAIFLMMLLLPPPRLFLLTPLVSVACFSRCNHRCSYYLYYLDPE